MRRIHRLMTLHFGACAPTRAISRELGISHSTVRDYLARIAAAGITWPLPAEVTDQELERLLFVNGGVRAGARRYVELDWAAVTRELQRPGGNLMILWEEYRAIHSDGYEGRLGGIYLLERISQESLRDYCTVMETLTAFERARREGSKAAATGEIAGKSDY